MENTSTLSQEKEAQPKIKFSFKSSSINSNEQGYSSVVEPSSDIIMANPSLPTVEIVLPEKKKRGRKKKVITAVPADTNVEIDNSILILEEKEKKEEKKIQFLIDQATFVKEQAALKIGKWSLVPCSSMFTLYGGSLKDLNCWKRKGGPIIKRPIVAPSETGEISNTATTTLNLKKKMKKERRSDKGLVSETSFAEQFICPVDNCKKIFHTQGRFKRHQQNHWERDGIPIGGTGAAPVSVPTQDKQDMVNIEIEDIKTSHTVLDNATENSTIMIAEETEEPEIDIEDDE